MGKERTEEHKTSGSEESKLLIISWYDEIIYELLQWLYTV